MNNSVGKELSRSRALAAKLVYATFQILKETGGELSSKRIFEEIPKLVKLDDWDLVIYEKTGYVRWRSILHFFTIDCIKSGFLLKQKGVWILTKEGESAIDKGERGLLEAITKGYQEWKAMQDALPEEDNISDESSAEQIEKAATLVIEEMESSAIEGLKNCINAMNPYEVQNLVAALLRGMGYYTPFIAQRGKDGGIDISAYRDPLGTLTPRIKVQVKHRNDPVSVDPIRQLRGVLQKSGDVGLVVSTSGFTSDARLEARTSHNDHVELIDLDRLIALWQEFYQKLSDEDKELLPLRAIFFLDSIK